MGPGLVRVLWHRALLAHDHVVALVWAHRNTRVWEIGHLQERPVESLLHGPQLGFERLDARPHGAHRRDQLLLLRLVLDRGNLFGDTVALGAQRLYILEYLSPSNIQLEDFIDGRSRVEVLERLFDLVGVLPNVQQLYHHILLPCTGTNAEPQKSAPRP